MHFATPIALFAAVAVAQDTTATQVVTSTTKQLVTVTQCHSTYTDCPLSASTSISSSISSSSSSSSSSAAVVVPTVSSSATPPAGNATAVNPTGVVPVVPSGTGIVPTVPTGAAARLQSGAMAAAAAAAVALAF